MFVGLPVAGRRHLIFCRSLDLEAGRRSADEERILTHAH
jgi:hypothetical protein